MEEPSTSSRSDATEPSLLTAALPDLITQYEDDLVRFLAELRTLSEATDKIGRARAKTVDESIARLERNLVRMRTLSSLPSANIPVTTSASKVSQIPSLSTDSHLA